MGTVFTAFNSGTDEAAANLTTEAAAGFQSPRTGSWTYETSSTVTVGGASIEVTNATPNTAAWTRVLGSVTSYYFDCCFLWTGAPSADFMGFQVRFDASNKAQFQLNADGSIVMKNGNTVTGIGPGAGYIVANQFVRMQWGVGSGTNQQQARVWTSSTVADLLNNPADFTWTGNYTGGAFNQFRVGVLDAVNVTHRLHRLIGDDSTWPVSGGATNVAPTANAGPDVDTYEGGDLVTLTGAASSDSDGTIASYAWRQTAGTTVDLSATNVVSPTFTAPATAGTATFGLRVTDDDGAQSTEDFVVIEWSDEAAAVPTSDWSELLNFATSGTVNESNTDLDNVTSGVWSYVTPGIGEGQGCAQATGSGSVKILTHDVTPGGEGFIDAIFTVSSLAETWYIMRALSGSTLRATVRVNTDGTIQTRNASSTTGQFPSVGKVVAGEKFRVAWHIDNGASTQTARLFLGANLYGTTPSSTATGTYNQGTFDHFGFGIAQPAVTAAAGTIKVDTLQYNLSDWVEPFGGSSEVRSGRYKINADGSTTPLNIAAL